TFRVGLRATVRRANVRVLLCARGGAEPRAGKLGGQKLPSRLDLLPGALGPGAYAIFHLGSEFRAFGRSRQPSCDDASGEAGGQKQRACAEELARATA